MALPGTHFRFAVAVKDQYSVQDERRYIAGTLYPDSRWLTGLSREKTHNDKYLDTSFATTDFTTGWYVHLLCDYIQAHCLKDAFPEIAGLDTESGWVLTSALKVAQDMEDSRHVDMAYCLGCLVDAKAPLGEDVAGISDYYRLVRRAYGAGAPPSNDAYHMQWEKVGVAPATIDAIMSQVQRLRSDNVQWRTLTDIFSAMVSRCAY